MKRSPRTAVLSIAMFCAALISGSMAASSLAHFNFGHHFISGHAIGDNSIDPITLVFRGNDQKVEHMSHFLLKWRGDGRGTMVDEGCGGDLGIWYLHTRIWDGEEDDEWHTDGCFRDKNHIRIWDSTEHDQDWDHPEAQRDKWAVGAVHHDDFTWEGDGLLPTDEIDVGWEVMETRARRQMDELCAYGNSVRLIGSGPDNPQGFHTNGKATRISPKEDQYGC